MMDDEAATPPIYTVRYGSAGEVMVIAPSGQVEFMSIWRFYLFIFSAIRKTAGRVKFVIEDPA